MGEGARPRERLPASGGANEQQNSWASAAPGSCPSSKGKEAADVAPSSPARGGSQLSRRAPSQAARVAISGVHADTAGASIVYAPTRSDVENIAAKLKSLGLAAEAYHAGLKPVHLARVIHARA